MKTAALAIGLAAIGLAGCSTLETLPLVSELPQVPIPAALHIEDTVDKPHTLIERALSGCDKRTEPGETACVKAAVAGAGLSLPALAALIDHCHVGQVCHVTYTTEDVIGLIRTAASRFVVHWRVDVDLTRPAATVDTVPITVVQV